MPNGKERQSVGLIEKTHLPEWKMVYGTTTGLKKSVNEDSLGITSVDDMLQVYLSDGHWGSEAATMNSAFWSERATSFPADRQNAELAVKELEDLLYQKFGKAMMDSDKDFTPEMSLLALRFDRRSNVLTVCSYGDCRLLVIRDKIPLYQMPTRPTWLGAFSKLGLRGRLPVEQALVFDEIRLLAEDRVFVYSDGVDECIYQKPTLATSDFTEFDSTQEPGKVFDYLMNKVFKHGAEDNASLVVINV